MTDTMTPPPAEGAPAEGTPELPPTPPPSPGEPAAPIGQPDAPPSPEAPPVEPPAQEESPAGEQPPAQEEPEGSGIPSLPIDEKGTSLKAEIRQIANEYVIPISDSAVNAWADSIKDKDTKPFKDYAKQVATGLYPTLAVQIEMGLPTRILLDPYLELAEKTFGEMPEEPDWTDHKWSAALQGNVDPKTGRGTPMTLSQWGDFLRTEPSHNFDSSPKAVEKVQDFIKAMDASFNNPSQGGAQ